MLGLQRRTRNRSVGTRKTFYMTMAVPSNSDRLIRESSPCKMRIRKAHLFESLSLFAWVCQCMMHQSQGCEQGSELNPQDLQDARVVPCHFLLHLASVLYLHENTTSLRSCMQQYYETRTVSTFSCCVLELFEARLFFQPNIEAFSYV